MLPNVELYNIAFEMAKLAKHWTTGSNHLGWVGIEQKATAPFNPFNALSQGIPSLNEPGGKETHLILKHSKNVWTKLHKLLKM